MKIKVIKENLTSDRKQEVVKEFTTDKLYVDVNRFDADEADAWLSCKDSNGKYTSEVYTCTNTENYRIKIEE